MIVIPTANLDVCSTSYGRITIRGRGTPGWTFALRESFRFSKTASRRLGQGDLLPPRATCGSLSYRRPDARPGEERQFAPLPHSREAVAQTPSGPVGARFRLGEKSGEPFVDRPALGLSVAPPAVPARV